MALISDKTNLAHGRRDETIHYTVDVYIRTTRSETVAQEKKNLALEGGVNSVTNSSAQEDNVYSSSAKRKFR